MEKQMASFILHSQHPVHGGGARPFGMDDTPR